MRPKDEAIGLDVAPGDGPRVVYPEERLPWPFTFAAGFQHIVAMFGAGVLSPLLMGFDPNVSIFFSGVATVLFYVILAGRVPSYLGSSFSFISAVTAATAYSGSGPNPNIAVALGGVVAAGALYALIGAVTMAAGHRWITRLSPPVVTGTIVAIIGLNLAPIAVRNVSGAPADLWFGLLTVALVAAAAAYAPAGFLRRVPILLGGGGAYLAYLVGCNGLGLGAPVDFAKVAAAPWMGLPAFTAPVFRWEAIALIAPIAIVLVVENLGHVKAVAAGTGRNLDPYIGRAFLADGVATMISGAGGGTGVTTYAENIGVMAVTRNYSSLTFVVAGALAIVLGLSPKAGAAILTLPTPIVGGLAFIIFGLISSTAVRIWVQDRTPMTTPNLLTIGVPLVIGAGDLTLKAGSFALGGIALGSFVCLALHHGLKFGRE
jgi:uracil-xanthine permease